MGSEQRQEAQVCIQASINAGQESHPDLLYLQSRWQADRRWLPGRHNSDLGQEPQRESSTVSKVMLYFCNWRK